MEQIINIIIQIVTIKVSWGLPDDMKIYIWLWFTGFALILGAISAAIRFIFRKIKEFTG